MDNIEPLPNPSPNRSKYLLWVLSVLILAAAIVFLLWRADVFKKAPLPSPTPSSTPNVLLLDARRTAVIKNAKVLFPAVTSSKVITKSQLPKIVSAIIPADAVSPVFKKLAYENGKVGYEVDFDENQPLLTTFNNFLELSNPELSFIDASRSTLFSIIEFQVSGSKGRIDLKYVSDNKNSVIIQTISN